jgi:hypothetical protein
MAHVGRVAGAAIVDKAARLRNCPHCAGEVYASFLTAAASKHGLREFQMGWYAVRTVYHFGSKSDGTNIFEERIVAFQAASFEKAHQKADAEAAEYEQHHGFTAHQDQMSYEQDGDELIDGYEIWSQLFEARLSLTEFYAERYARFDHHPEKRA